MTKYVFLKTHCSPSPGLQTQINYSKTIIPITELTSGMAFTNANRPNMEKPVLEGDIFKETSHLSYKAYDQSFSQSNVTGLQVVFQPCQVPKPEVVIADRRV